MIDVNSLGLIGEAINRIGLRFRVRASFDDDASPWTTVLGFPSPGYVEPKGMGPISIKQLVWIEIDPIKEIVIGMRVKPKQEDRTRELVDFLNEHKIAYTHVNGFIHIDIQS